MSTELIDLPHVSSALTERYVIGVDGSGPSIAALHWGIQRAEFYGADVVLAHVRSASAPEAAGQVILDAAVSIVRSAHPTVRVSQVLLTGHVADELTREASDSALLVIGTHKTGYLHGRVMGSRGLMLVSLAHASVAIIPDVSLLARRGVVVGIDPARDSASTTRIAALEADRTKQYLTVITAESFDHPHAIGSTPMPGGRESLALASRRASRFAPGLEVHSRASGRMAAEALLDASRSATLLVLAAVVPPESACTPVGSVTHDILMNINAPVLVVRDASVAADSATDPLQSVGASA